MATKHLAAKTQSVVEDGGAGRAGGVCLQLGS